ncbi:MAG TPA: HDOD domain-containing protein [Dissulfurispiraceae bacterium]|nr:HDOD domain-containing protein [Dissulfurispiraceae bacterium]
MLYFTTTMENGKDKALRVLVQKIPKLPTLPMIAERILGMVDDDVASVETIVETVAQDPAIAAKVLSFANAAFYGAGEPVLSVRDAVMKIGFKNIRSIALGISLMTIFSESKEKFASAYHRIFLHSVSVGVISRQIAEKVACELADKAFIAGLLHDIGKLVINKYFEDDYARILDEFNNGLFLIDAEKKVLGITHADIGVWLADKWNLPAIIQDAIEFHHAPSEAKNNRKLVALAHVANAVAARHSRGLFEVEPVNAFDSSALEILGISEKDLETIESGLDKQTFPAELFQ